MTHESFAVLFLEIHRFYLLNSYRFSKLLTRPLEFGTLLIDLVFSCGWFVFDPYHGKAADSLHRGES